MSPLATDRIKQLSGSSWTIIAERGECFEAEDGDTILELAQTNNHLLIILAGKATLIYFQEGRRQPTAIYRNPGEVLHHAGMHLKVPNPFAIEAADTPTRVVLIDRDTVYDIIGQDTSFAEYLFKDLSERFMVALGYLREQRQEPLIKRLAKRILAITEHRSAVELTQAELAEIMAVTRISISKAIKTLEDLELIKRVERGHISVDRENLLKWLETQ